MIMKLHTLSPHESRMCPMDFGAKSQGHGALVIENGFQTITYSNSPMMLKLHTPVPYESRMCLMDFGVKGLGLLGIEISQGCSMFIQRVFATRLFAFLKNP